MILDIKKRKQSHFFKVKIIWIICEVCIQVQVVHCPWKPSMEGCLPIIGPSVVRPDVVPITPVINSHPLAWWRSHAGAEDCESQVCSMYQGQRQDLGTKKDNCYLKLKGSFKSCLALQRLGPQWTKRVTVIIVFFTKCLSLIFVFLLFLPLPPWDDRFI